MQLKIEYLSKNDLKPYVNNAKIHTEKQVKQIKKSIEEFDFNDPIAVWGENEIVEGHGRLLAAMQMDDIDTIPIIRLDHLTDEQRRAYALVHNKLTMNTDFDKDLLDIELNNIIDLDMSAYDLLVGDEDNPYTTKVNIPQYQIKGENPPLYELFDREKTEQFIKNIEESSINDDEKRFLKYAAERHCVFNYSKIAEYYAHASQEMQRLMEEQALVIIDFENAIANGYVRLSKNMKEIREDNA